MSYLCIRVPEFPVQALLSLRPELAARAVAVLEHEPPLEQVCSRNRRAHQQGIRHGMKRTDLEAIDGLTALPRSLREEQSLRNALLLLCAQITPRVETIDSDSICCIMLDLAGTERLLGAPHPIATRLEQQMRALHVEAAFTISQHFFTAIIVARTLRSGSVPTSIPAGQERAALTGLPIAVLEPDAEQAETFARWGIRTLGQLAALPVDELIARMGQAAGRLHALASGTHPHLFRPLEPVAALEAHAELEDAIELVDSLLFILGPMLDRLIALVSSRALGLLSVQLLLTLDSRQQHLITVRPALPSLDRTFLLKLLQLELAAHPPAAAVIGIHISGVSAPPAQQQGGLFSPQLPDASRLDVTLARIQSIVGEGNVGSAQIQDTHAPHTDTHDDTHAPQGFSVQPFHVKATPHTAQVTISTRTACRMLRPPWPARVSHQASRPCFVACDHQRFQVKHAYGPWYSSGAWWGPGAWSREEWEVILRAENAPVPLHALLVHDLVAKQWRLEGFYD